MKFNGGAIVVPAPGGDRISTLSLLPNDLEYLLREINEFCSSNSTPAQIPRVLEDYLNYVAKTGNIVFPWPTVKGLFRYKLTSSLSQFSGPPGTEDEQQVFNRFDLFRSAPFTIQRLTELINNPTYHYKLKEKYLFALEKTVFVVSTVEPFDINSAANGEGDGEKNGDDGDGDSQSSEELNSTFVLSQDDPLAKDEKEVAEVEQASTEMEISKDDDESLVVTTSTVTAQEAEKPKVEAVTETEAPASTPTQISETPSEDIIISEGDTEIEMTPVTIQAVDIVVEPAEVIQAPVEVKEELIVPDPVVNPTPNVESIKVDHTDNIKIEAQTDEEENMVVDEEIEVELEMEIKSENQPTIDIETQGTSTDKKEDPISTTPTTISDPVVSVPTPAPATTSLVPNPFPCNLFLCKKSMRKWDMDLY